MSSEVSGTHGEPCTWLGLNNTCRHLRLQRTHLCQAGVGTNAHTCGGGGSLGNVIAQHRKLVLDVGTDDNIGETRGRKH